MEKITYGKYYHILNRGTNKQNIFVDNGDYNKFFNLMSIFLEPVADIYAYAAMKNHFHIAVRIKTEEEIGYLNPKHAKTEDLDKKWKIYGLEDARLSLRTNRGRSTFELPKELEASLKKPNPGRMFQHFCSTYAKYFNTKHRRTGALLQHPYKRILVDNEHYLKRLILYLHNNPVKHGFCEHPVEYSWTSYLSLMSIKPTKLARKKVLGFFDNQANFKLQHKSDDDFEDIEFLFLE